MSESYKTHRDGRSRYLDISGMTFNALTVLGPANNRADNGDMKWTCRCECGSVRDYIGRRLRCGRIKSCGCKRSQYNSEAHFEHGLQNTREYRIWVHMRQRCRDKNGHAYHLYGGRGITICPRWDDFPTFLADMGPCPANYSIDRIDVNGNYEPSNCRWASHLEQGNNKRNNVRHLVEGEFLTVSEVARLLHRPRPTVDGWLKKRSAQELVDAARRAGVI